MTYSYTQISQYLSCPRRYKHRYLDGWKEKDTRAAMVFGRAFEQAVAAYFERQDAAAVLYRKRAAHRESGLNYSERDKWDRMLHSGVQLLDRFAKDDRIVFLSLDITSRSSSPNTGRPERFRGSGGAMTIQMFVPSGAYQSGGNANPQRLSPKSAEMPPSSICSNAASIRLTCDGKVHEGSLVVEGASHPVELVRGFEWGIRCAGWFLHEPKHVGTN